MLLNCPHRQNCVDLLSDNGELLGGIDGLAGPEEVPVTHTVGVEVTSILVADTVLTVVTVTAVGLVLAASLSRMSAAVHQNRKSMD